MTLHWGSNAPIHNWSTFCFLNGDILRNLNMSDMYTPKIWNPQSLIYTFITLVTQVYIPKRRTLIQVLPPANAFTKLFATCSCIFTFPFVSPSCIYAIRPVCVHHGVHIGCLMALLRQNAYRYEQITKEFEPRKYLYECTFFGFVNLW